MARLIIKKYKNNNDKSAAYGKTYGRLVHQDTMNTSDLCRSLLSHSYQAYMFILTQRRRDRRVLAENYFTQNYYFTQKAQNQQSSESRTMLASVLPSRDGGRR